MLIKITTYLLHTLAVLSGISLVLMFPALNDIAHDYVSIDTLKYAGVQDSIVKTLPSWASTPTEWFLVQAGFLCLSLFVLIFLLRTALSMNEQRKV